jgi:hypothetical protein
VVGDDGGGGGGGGAVDIEDLGRTRVGGKVGKKGKAGKAGATRAKAGKAWANDLSTGEKASVRIKSVRGTKAQPKALETDMVDGKDNTTNTTNIADGRQTSRCGGGAGNAAVLLAAAGFLITAATVVIGHHHFSFLSQF